MKVIISVPGRFHAFNLVQQLLKHDSLERLITSYPKFEVKKYGIPENKIRSVVLMELMSRGWRKFLASTRNFYNPQYFFSEFYDKSASKMLSSCDICVAWAGFGLRVIRRAKSLGAKTIIERGSSHIVYQSDLMKEEYSKLGLRPVIAHPKVIEKELREYEEADYISIPSLFTKRTFLSNGVPNRKLIHTPYGVDLSYFKQVPKKDNIFRVVFVGGMSLRKGVHYLLQAFSELNLPNSELLLVGSLNNEIKPFFKKYEDKYKYIGHVPQKEIYKYYSQSSVFVMMSIEEGLGMVQLQAMACGLPVIATANTGAEDIIREGIDGFIIPIRSVERLKEKIVYFYENPDICKKMGESAKERVTESFGWDDYGTKMVKAYENILKQR